jgi:pyruvate dehydrogenase E1 component alpha subunit
MMTATAEELIAFEAEIAELFTARKISAVTHLYSGGEESLIDIFKSIRPNDWVLGHWRSHYQCLLKGVPKDELRAAILAGNSVALSFPKYRILCSAIVGGMLPIAVGLALGIKMRGEDTQVHVFLGDMASEMGVAHECMKYAENFMLPVTFWIEDNGRSAQTDTKKVWGLTKLTREPAFSYKMERYMHAGVKNWIKF